MRDLGKNTVYRAGQPIDPGVEATNDPNCRPLPGWRFTLGTGYKTRAVSGPWGSLSIVTSPYDTDIVTEARVPLLDYAGRPTDDFVEGATTIELTKAQAIRAATANSLWIQGGTPSDPILDGPYPGQFGFGALRCSVDNLNGDNVEWIAYPQGTEHVFCYAYYVRPPPTSGTIVIRKEVRGTPGATQTFTFDGNLSFNEGNLFNLRVSNGQPASQTFYRAATDASDAPWVVHERVPGGWRLAQLSCLPTAGSSVTTDLAGARLEIRLAPGDTVTCTYVNEVRPPAGELFIRKLTRGGIGSFDFDVKPVGGGAGAKAHAETQQERVAVDAQPSPLTLSPGTYRIDEQLPESRAGRWRLDNVICGGLLGGGLGPDRSDDHRRRRGHMHLREQLRPVGQDRDRQGHSGRRHHDRVRDLPRGRSRHRVPEVGHDERARRGSSRGGFGHQRTPARRSTSSRSWSRLPTRIATGRSSRWSAMGASSPQWRDAWSSPSPATIRGGSVASQTPSATTPTPPEPPGPSPPVPGGPTPDIVVTKRADRLTATRGEIVTYRLIVRNKGEATAEEIIAGDLPGHGARVVSTSARGPRCHKGRVLYCRIKVLRPGQSATAKLRLRLLRPGRFPNAAAAISSTPEPTYRNNRAAARVRVRPVPPFCLPAARPSSGPHARAAC